MKILYPADQVTRRIEEIAQKIIHAYPTDKPLFVCLLKGAVPFTSQLLSSITRLAPQFHPEVEYMHISDYGENRTATAATTYRSMTDDTIQGRHVVLLDDCLDQGLTYRAAKEQLLNQGAASVQLIVLANKQTNTVDREEPLISGFITPDVWLVGMGMDDAATAPDAERWSGYIGHVSPE